MRLTTTADATGKAPPLPEFSLDGYARLLDFIQTSGFVAIPLLEWQAAKQQKVIFLRHDVDISTNMALRLGQCEAERGMRASYFFQLNTETYHLLTEPNLGVVRSLRELGHSVGLHIDQLLTGDDESSIDQTIRWFSETVSPIDRVISFHRPTPDVVGRHYSQFLNAYDPCLFSEDTYCSDSRRSLEFWGKLVDWLKEGRSPLQLLTHPAWWGGHQDAAAVWHELAERRQQELASYLLSNFRKVFSGVVPHEDRDFGV